MSILKNLNYLAELNTLPCATPDPLIMIKTAVPAAAAAFLEIVIPDCEDIQQLALAGRRPFLTPNPGTFKIGHTRVKAPPKLARAGRALSAFEWMYRVPYAAAERLLYWWLIADVTLEFVANWTTMAYQSQQCQVPGAGTLETTIIPFVYSGNLISQLSFVTRIKLPCAAANLGYIEINPGCSGTIAYSVDWIPWNNQPMPASISTYIVRQDTEQVVQQATTNHPITKNGWRTGGAYHHPGDLGGPPVRYRIGVTTQGGGFAQAAFGWVKVGLMGKNVGVRPFGCKLKPVEWPFPKPEWL